MKSSDSDPAAARNGSPNPGSLGPRPDPSSRFFLPTDTHQSLLSGADGWHPIGSHAHSDVSGNGWLVANTASTLNGAADYRLALWNSSQTLVSLPAQANGFFYPLHLADLDEGQLLIAAGNQSGIGSEVFLSESGTARHLPSLTGKNIRLFAGDGTGMTSDGKLWRNGELIPMRAICSPHYGELLDDGWSIMPIKGNKYGNYLIQAENPANNATRHMLLASIRILIPELNEHGIQNPESYVVAKELKVAKWEDAFEGTFSSGLVKDDFIELDKDRFYLAVANGVSLGITAAEVGTVDNPNPDKYDDDPTRIDLVDVGDGNGVVSSSMILVTDDQDDDFSGSGAGEDDEPNDRTHRVQLGGKFLVKSLTIRGESSEVNMKIPVPAKRRIEIDVYRLNVAQVNTNEQINESIVLMKECYAQVALEISATVHQAAWPQEVEDAKVINGSTSGPGVFRLFDLFPNLNVGTLTNEYKAFIDGLDIHGVNIFFLTTMFGSNGYAVSIKQLGRETNLQLKYIDNAFINFQMLNGAPLGHTPSHELLHILGHKDLDEDDHAQFYTNLLFVGNANDEPVFFSKRIDSVQESTIYRHDQVKNIDQ